MINLNTIKGLRNKLMNFLNLEKNNSFLILTDDDEDGLTSATQLKRFLENKGKKANVFFNEKRSIIPGAINESEVFKNFFDKTNPDLIIFLDLNESLAAQNLKQISNNIPIIIIDHHPSPEKIAFSNPLFVIKPTLFSDIAASQYSTTKLVYDFFDGNSLEATVGLIGDSAVNEWSDFINGALKEFDLTMNQAIKISDIIKANYSMKKDKYELFNFVYKNGIKKILGSEFEDNSISFQELVKSETKRFDVDLEKFDEFDLVFFETKNGLASKLSNVLSKLHKQTLVIYSKDEYVKGSVRRNDFLVNVEELIKYAIGDDKIARGGGHIPAGGFACLNYYWPEFKKRAIEYAKKNLPKK